MNREDDRTEGETMSRRAGIRRGEARCPRYAKTANAEPPEPRPLPRERRQREALNVERFNQGRFIMLVSRLHTLLEEATAAKEAAGRGPKGREWAVLCTKIEEAIAWSVYAGLELTPSGNPIEIPIDPGVDSSSGGGEG